MAKEMKKPMKSTKEKRMDKKMKHGDEKEDMALLKKKVKTKCMK